MKFKFVIIVLCLLAFRPLVSLAQQADAQISRLVNGASWIELSRTYPQLRDSVQSPVLKLVAEAMIGYELNRPKLATDAVYGLLQNYQQQLGGGNIYNFIIILGKVLRQHGDYAQAASVMQTVATALKGQPQTGMVKAITDYNRELQAIRNLPPLSIDRGATDVLLGSDDRWTLPVTLHGRTYNFTLSQQSEYSAITPSAARELGLRVLPDTLLHLDRPVQIAVIDSMQLGGITVRNLLVDILRLPTTPFCQRCLTIWGWPTAFRASRSSTCSMPNRAYRYALTPTREPGAPVRADAVAPAGPHDGTG